MHKLSKLSTSAWLVIFLACGADPNTSSDTSLARQDAGQYVDTGNSADDVNAPSDAAVAPDQATHNPDAWQPEQDACTSGQDAARPDSSISDSTSLNDTAITSDASPTDNAEQTDSATGNMDASLPDNTQNDGASSASFADDEILLFKQLYDMPSMLADEAENLILMLGQAILFCDHKNGTMTQDANGGWICQADDSGHMLIHYYNGAVLDYTISQADAYLLGTAQDFADSHILDFVATQTGWFNLHIFSMTWPNAEVSGKIDWARFIMGTDRLFDMDTDVDFSDSGSKKSEVSGSFASYDLNHTYSGSATASTSHFQFDESWRSLQMHNSNTSTHAVNNWRNNNGQANMNGHSYSFDSLDASWAKGSVLGSPGTFNKAIDNNFWSASGVLTRDGQGIADVVFDAPVIENSSGPNFALRPTQGDDIILEATTDSP